ncbi:MAG: hypothetical protein K0Q60_4729, partial [Microvirga sp.]|nr:hypothetical protein [Microvirga sp.]
QIRAEVRSRMGRFVNLAAGNEATSRPGSMVVAPGLRQLYAQAAWEPYVAPFEQVAYGHAWRVRLHEHFDPRKQS